MIRTLYKLLSADPKTDDSFIASAKRRAQEALDG